MSTVLEPVEEKIIQYIHYNPGCSKTDITHFLERINAASRLTVLTYLDKLENKQMIIYKRDRPNSKTYKIYINKDNKLASVLIQLEEFKVAYINLLEKSKEILFNKDYSKGAKELGIQESNPGNWTLEDRRRYSEWEISKLRNVNTEFEAADEAINTLMKVMPSMKGLEKKKIVDKVEPLITKLTNATKGFGENMYFMIESPVDLFYIIVDSMFYLGVIKWPQQIPDKEQLGQIYSVVYNKISELQLALSEFIGSIKVSALDPTRVIIRGRKKSQFSLGIIVALYSKLGMSQEIEKVRDSIIKINQDISELELIRLYPSITAVISDPEKYQRLIVEDIQRS